MASTKKTTPAKTATPKNKPAPASPGTSAEETGSGAASAAPGSNLSATETGSSPTLANPGIPPVGEQSGTSQQNDGNDNKGKGESGTGSQGEDKAEKKNDNRVKSFIVSAKAEGFRRAGRAWSKAATTVSAGDLTDAQIEALLGEPMLDVVTE